MKLYVLEYHENSIKLKTIKVEKVNQHYLYMENGVGMVHLPKCNNSTEWMSKIYFLDKKMTRRYFEKMKNDRLGNVNERIELLKKVHNDIEGQTYEDLLCTSDRQ